MTVPNENQLGISGTDADNFFGTSEMGEQSWENLKKSPKAFFTRLQAIIGDLEHSGGLEKDTETKKKLNQGIQKLAELEHVTAEEAFVVFSNLRDMQVMTDGFTSERTAEENSGNTKEHIIETARGQNSFYMFGEVIDNVLDNFEENYAEMVAQNHIETVMDNHLNIKIDFYAGSSVDSHIRFRENSGGIHDDDNHKLFWSKGQSTHSGSSIGRFNKGLKLAMPHLGLWHQISTWKWDDHDNNKDKTEGKVGNVWSAGSHEEPSGADPHSRKERDFWASENITSYVPKGNYFAQKNQHWVTKAKGRSEFYIRRLTEKGMKMIHDQERFDQLISFLSVIWGNKILQGSKFKQAGVDVTFTITHPLTEYKRWHISTKESIGDDKMLSFRDLASDEFISKNFIEIPGVSPKEYTETKKVPKGQMSIKWITGVQKVTRSPYGEGQSHNFHDHTGDPYSGFYLFGNGRLFHRAYQPDTKTRKIWDTRQVLPHLKNKNDRNKQRTVVQLSMDLRTGSQDSYFVCYVFFEGPSEEIPFQEVKWALDVDHHIVDLMKDVAIRMGREGNTIMNQVQNLGATDAFRNPLAARSSRLDNPTLPQNGAGGDADANAGAGANGEDGVEKE